MPHHRLIADGPAQPDATVIDKFWAEAQKSFPELGCDYQVRSLGIDAETTTQIFEYIKTRETVASSSLPSVIEANGSPYSDPGTPIVLFNYVSTPHLIVRLTDVRECTDDLPVLIEPFDYVGGRGNLMAMPTCSAYIIIGAEIHGNFWSGQNSQICGYRRWRFAKNVSRAPCPN